MASPVPYPRFLPCGDAALIVEFGNAVDKALNDKVLALDQRLAAAPPDGMVETVPTFRSLMVHLDPLVTDPATVEAHIAGLLGDLAGSAAPGPIWRVPVCYEGDLAPDLEDVARATGTSATEVVALHSGALFQIYMLGFLPGFPYLGGLPDTLYLPRRTNPRTRVPAGSVAIAQSLSAIYPVVSPGGWHLIGNTPIRLFDSGRDDPALFASGDRIRFVPVEAAEFARIADAVAGGDFVVEKETV
ncbi:MAG: 5-oxoprolinase subunit PxpB [Alphaproteobacteria bacterium]|nr:5-oxoprolinase subunit PxpB [Alphaproteobacteria bacterium]